MRYLIDNRDVDLEISLTLYQATLAWAATRGDRFLLSLQPSIYEDPNDVTQLCALGQVTAAPVPEVPDNPLSRVLAKLFRRPIDIVQVTGAPHEAFVQELTRKAAPLKAVSGDVSPVEDVVIFVGERILYGSYDYGRDQVLDLAAGELESLRQTLQRAGLDPDRVIPAPPQMADSPS